MSSTIVAARKKLYDLLVAELGQAGRQITYGAPREDTENEVLAILDVFDAEESEAELGGGAKWEEYQIEVGIKVVDPSREADAYEVEAAGLVLYDALRDVVHGRSRGGDRSLDGVLSSGWASVRTPQMRAATELPDGGWVVFFRGLIFCKARIT